jgi:hypothetical protein
MAKPRALMATHLEGGFAVSGRCSRCHRPFDSKPSPSPIIANRELLAAFEQHVCDEDSGQAALRVARSHRRQVGAHFSLRCINSCMAKKCSYLSSTASGLSLS